MRYAAYPREVAEDIVRLRRRLESANLPPRRTDDNLLVGTWNIRNFGRVHSDWLENPASPERNLRALPYIAEIIRRFDVVAIQEVKRDTTGIRLLVDRFLGPNWGVLLSDVSGGDKGNDGRLAYLYDRRRVTPSGLAGEIVLTAGSDGVPVEQFDRTPYVVGFRAGEERFTLLTVHIRWGDLPADRVRELGSPTTRRPKFATARGRRAPRRETSSCSAISTSISSSSVPSNAAGNVASGISIASCVTSRRASSTRTRFGPRAWNPSASSISGSSADDDAQVGKPRASEHERPASRREWLREARSRSTLPIMASRSLPFDDLTAEERIELMGRLWDSLDPATAAPVTDALAAELERREQEADADPESGESWHDVRAELNKKLE